MLNDARRPIDFRSFGSSPGRKPSTPDSGNIEGPSTGRRDVCLAVEPFGFVAIVVERPRDRPLRTRVGRVGAV
jgi:hypothetical protein